MLDSDSTRLLHEDGEQEGVTTHLPLAVWRYYIGWADCKNVIKEL